MRLRTKTFTLISLMAFVVFVALYLIASTVILPSFVNLEKQENQQSLLHTLNVLDYKLADLSGKTNDYAAWDDTYYFIQHGNSGYLENNLVDSTFQNMQVNLIVMFDTQGSIFYCQSYDLLNKSKVSTSEDIKESLKMGTCFWSFSVPQDNFAGIILLNDQPTYIASRPILTSDEEGPVMGTLLFGAYIDEEECNTLSTLTNLDVSVYSISDLDFQHKEQLQSLSANDQIVFTEETSSEQLTGYYLMEDINSHSSIVLQVSQSRNTFQQGLGVMYLFLAFSLALSVLFGAGMMVLFERSVVGPLNKLTSYVKGMSSDSSDSKSSPRFGTEETAILAKAIKDAMTLKLETIHEMGGMVGHDLRNPLTGIKGATYYLTKKCSSQIGETGNLMLKTIDECVEYSNKIVNDLLDYSGEMKLELMETTPKGLLMSSLSTLQIPSNVKLIDKTEDETLLMVDVGKMRRVLNNLIKNAFDAMPDGGQFTVTSRKGNGMVGLIFSDNGMGMSEETLTKLWVPFFTTKAKGMGFGLSICKRIIEAHGGRIEVNSTLGKGTEFIVSIPLKTN